MKKQEYIPLHGLFRTLSDYMDVGFSEEYMKLDVGPGDVHKEKDLHKYAVFALSLDINRELEDREHEDSELWASLEEYIERLEDDAGDAEEGRTEGNRAGMTPSDGPENRDLRKEYREEMKELGVGEFR